MIAINKFKWLMFTNNMSGFLDLIIFTILKIANSDLDDLRDVMGTLGLSSFTNLPLLAGH